MTLFHMNYDLETANHAQKMLTIRFGKYYNPAYTHYSNDPINVICDNCRKNNLRICIGYGKVDLCLVCADTLNDNLYGRRPIDPNYHTMCINPHP